MLIAKCWLQTVLIAKCWLQKVFPPFCLVIACSTCWLHRINPIQNCFGQIYRLFLEDENILRGSYNQETTQIETKTGEKKKKNYNVLYFNQD